MDPQKHERAAVASSADRVWSEFMAALNGLAPDMRAAFVLHEIFEAGYDDIARLIGLPAETCRRHVEHARGYTLDRMRPLCHKTESTAL